MPTIASVMQDIADYFGTVYQVRQGDHEIEIPFSDGRSQLVSATIGKDLEGRDTVLFFTTVGDFSSELNLKSLMEENIKPLYARIAIFNDKVVVVAGQLLETAQLEEVITIVQEVANFGDYLEAGLFGRDRY